MTMTVWKNRKNSHRLGLIFLALFVLLTASVRGEDAPQPQSSDESKPPASTGSTATAVAPSDDTGYVTEKKDGKTYKYKKKATYDFEGASIDGLYNKPSGSYISNIKDVKGKSIIRIRENFDAEVIDSGRLVK